MSSRYGVGRYGMGEYSSATTEERASTSTVSLVTPATDWSRARDFESMSSFELTTSDARAHPQRNSVSTSEILIDTIAIPTYVRQLVGEATLVLTFGESMRGNYEVDGHSTALLELAMSMQYYAGPYWNPEPIDGNWTPEAELTDIWVPELDPQRPWG